MNIERNRGTRRKPIPGDIFAFRVPSRGWLFGRVIRTTETDPGFGFGELPTAMVYIYNVIGDSVRPVPELALDNLLIPPVLMDLSGWRLGYLQNVTSQRLRASDMLKRHCFQWGSVYNDEFGTRINKPFEPIGSGGWGDITFLDREVSEALGLPLGSDATRATPRPNKRRSSRDSEGPFTVTIYLPGKEARCEDDLDEIEDRIRIALKERGAGEWEGHGVRLDTGFTDTRFVGHNRSNLIAAVRAGRSQVKLPRGWYATIRANNGEEERIRV